MAVQVFEHSSELAVPSEVAFQWHTRPGALERLTPPWEQVRVLESAGGIEGGRVTLEVALGPFRTRWVAQHRDAVSGRQFVDEQVEGPFARWIHTHLFEPLPGDRCRYTDRIEYELPGGAAGALGAGRVRTRLERTFRHRHATLAADLAMHARHAGGPLTVAVTGATGLLGRALVALLQTGGHRVRRVTRGPAGPEDISWDPDRGVMDRTALDGTDAVVHLAGEPIAGGRWTAGKRRRILESRTRGTTLVAEAIASLPNPPRVLVSASAIGIYGDRGSAILTEGVPIRHGPQATFVEQVGRAWEAGVEPATHAGVRVVRARIGIVLTPAGGALAEMLAPFLAGVGGRLGSGKQYTSWIGVDDVLGAMHHAILSPALAGPVNLTAPEPVTNAEFTRVLAHVLGRPAIFPVPAAVLRLLFGDLADELLLASARVLPSKLQESHYSFRHTGLEAALRHVLGR